jgi:hypothetical protein
MTGLPDEDLSDLVRPTALPDRAAGLADLVRDPAVLPGAPSQRRPDAAESIGGSRARRRRGRATPVTIYVSRGVRARFVREWRRQGVTKTVVVLGAIEARAKQLRAVLDRSRVSTRPSASGLFPAGPNEVRYLGTGDLEIQITPTPEQLQVLNDLTTKLAMPRRSTWIAAVLNDVLPGKKDEAG